MNLDKPTVQEKRAAFRRLHESGCFLLPNPWDLGSARYLQSLGFKALATTSSGFAWSKARADGSVNRDHVLEHFREMAQGCELPINADFEHGFADDEAGVAESVRLAVETGVAGLSIEDATGNPERPLYDFEVALARVRAARVSIDRTGSGALLVARAEGILLGRSSLEEVVARLKAFAGAGADCLYAPGLRTAEQIAAVVEAVSPKPVNVLVGWDSELTLDRIAALGARRISVGGALARCAWQGFMRAARQLAEQGSFRGFADAASGSELNSLFIGDS